MTNIDDLKAAKLDLTVRQRERLERLWRRFSKEPLSQEVRPEVLRLLDVDIGFSIFGSSPSPLIAAPGPATASLKDVEKLASSGWGTALLPAVVLDAEDGPRRQPEMWLRTLHARDDLDRLRPLVTWSNSEDSRTLEDYAAFCADASQTPAAAASSESRTRIVPGIFGPAPTEANVEHWQQATKLLAAAGADAIRIKFTDSSPAPMTGLNAPVPLWLAASSCGSPFGGCILQIGQSVSDSAARPVISGARVYSGLEILQDTVRGASGVLVFDFLVGKIGVILKRSMSKAEQVAYKLLLDPSDGLVAGLVHLRNTVGISRYDDAIDLARKETAAE